MCKYCSGESDILDEYNANVSISETDKGYSFFVNGVVYFKTRINFCPMCGKKLTPFEINL